MRRELSNGRASSGFDWPHMKAYLLVTFVANSLVSAYTDYQMCLRIRHAGLARQGPRGPLATDTVRFRPNVAAPDGKYRARAYWSAADGLGIGYPAPRDPNAPRRSGAGRRPLDEVVHYNRFGQRSP